MTTAKNRRITINKLPPDEQARMVEESRRESVLDPAIPLALPWPTRVERGLPIAVYFKKKHAAGQIGRFYPLHLTEQPAWT
jgi:hypothetical protein